MSAPRARVARLDLAVGLLTTLGFTAATIGATAVQAAETVAQNALNACANIAADAERLACYDRLAGRAASNAPPPAALPGAPVRPPAVAAMPAATARAAPVPPPSGTFGLYEAEHPKPPPAAVPPSLEARVAALGTSAGGRMTVSLVGGAVWELVDADPLLAVGDTVTITRAAFGSYLIHTPTRRTHRAQRLH